MEGREGGMEKGQNEGESTGKDYWESSRLGSAFWTWISACLSKFSPNLGQGRAG